VENNKLAMTFDDGPTPGVTQSVLTHLKNNGVKATFLTVGRMIDASPALLQAELADGHSLHSHTYTHTSMFSLSQQQIFEELSRTDTAFKNAGVCRRPVLVRPPYGEINAAANTILRRSGYRAIIWNVDTNDWQMSGSYTPARVISEFQQQMDAIKPAGVLALQHDLMQFSADIVPQIISNVKSRGYSFISVDQCLWGANFKRNPSWVFANRLCGQSDAGWPSVTASEPCPVSEWSDWSDCDVSCGPGTQTRVRLTMPPSLAQTSAACGSVPLIESRACSGQAACSSSCTYNAWTNWGACSKSCGGGTQIQTRTVKSGGSGCGAVLQTQVCNTQACVSRRALRGE
jgi:peptidoglycan-N-acetylglucosamine deacetylase